MTRKKTELTPAIRAALLLLASSLAEPVSAELQGRSLTGAGVDNDPNTFEAYYDTVLNVLWLKDANLLATQTATNPGVATDIVTGTPSFSDPFWGSQYDPATGLYPVTIDADLTNPNAGNGDGAIDGSVTWFGARAWIKWLNVQSYGGFYDWRLPKVKPRNGNSFALGGALDGSTDDGYRITSPNSELSHLFYVTLGNSAAVDLQGNDVSGAGLTQSGPFAAMQKRLYWYGSDTPDSGTAWAFQASTGYQTASSDKPFTYAFAWAVRSGDVDTPSNPDTGSNPAPSNTKPDVTVPASDAAAPLDVIAGTPWSQTIWATDVDRNAMALRLLKRPKGLLLDPAIGTGSISATVSWTPSSKFADKTAFFSVQASETSKEDHPEGFKSLLKSDAKTVYLRVFPAGKSAANGVKTVKITAASWDAAGKQLSVQGTVTPLRILTPVEVDALQASGSVELQAVTAAGNQTIPTDPITVTGGNWHATITLESPPCALMADFAGTASKSKPVKRAPAGSCTR